MKKLDIALQFIHLCAIVFWYVTSGWGYGIFLSLGALLVLNFIQIISSIVYFIYNKNPNLRLKIKWYWVSFVISCFVYLIIFMSKFSPQLKNNIFYVAVALNGVTSVLYLIICIKNLKNSKY